MSAISKKSSQSSKENPDCAVFISVFSCKTFQCTQTAQATEYSQLILCPTGTRTKEPKEATHLLADRLYQQFCPMYLVCVTLISRNLAKNTRLRSSLNLPLTWPSGWN